MGGFFCFLLTLEKIPKKFGLTSVFSAHFVQAAAGANTAGYDEYYDDDHRHYTSRNGNGIVLQAIKKREKIQFKY